jgi:hypothetical protein
MSASPAFSLATGRHLGARDQVFTIYGAKSPNRGRGTVVALDGGVPIDLLIGRALAWCVHPTAAWRRLPARGRVLLVAAYVGASYTTVLTLLFAL